MRKSNYNFETALEHLERLKKISYSSLPTHISHSQNSITLGKGSNIDQMKQSLKNIESYLKRAGDLPRSEANKALQESHFLISGVQNVFSFLENREQHLYQSLVHDYSELNKVYSKTQEDLSHKLVDEHTSDETSRPEVNESSEERFLNNLVEVKQDRSYELFYMSDEENKRFYTDTLTQIICKQGKLHETAYEGDPLIKTVLWHSEEVHHIVSSLVFTNDMSMRIFYKSALSNLEIEAVEKTHNAVMALFFSRYKETIVINNPTKDNISYFHDFLYFLRQAWKALSSTTTQEELIEKQSHQLVSALSNGLFESKLMFTEAARYLYFHIQVHPKEENRKSLLSGQYIKEMYDDLYRFLSKYPNGPLFKAIDRLLEPRAIAFDPIILGMLPSWEGTLKLGDKSIRIIRSPSPITQGSILYATCNEEFLGFLTAKEYLQETTLVLNIQNRTSRKDRARSRVIEESIEGISRTYVFSFPEPEELLKSLENIHGEQETFFEIFSTLKEEFHNSGSLSLFSIPKIVQEDMHQFLDYSLDILKDTLFSKKKILFKKDKLLLLHMVAYLTVFKLIELINPNNLLVISKDGLDYASVFIAGFSFFSNGNDWDEHKLKLLLVKILTPTLVARDRLVFVQHIELLSKFVNCLRKNRQNLSNLKQFFEYDLEKWDFSDYLSEITEVSHKQDQ
ncbi:calcium-binding protein [Chlamydia gallinacea]|uniref:calcium-binding protein n=1 Tax=Chlamydia gallinacea TaxID=1457153 RepID=UPI0024E1F4C8|nr:calcium-binding protein [Chlamydia gallinacea]